MKVYLPISHGNVSHIELETFGATTSFIVDVTKIRSWIECRKMYLSVFRAGRESVQFFILNVSDGEQKSLQDM